MQGNGGHLKLICCGNHGHDAACAKCISADSNEDEGRNFDTVRYGVAMTSENRENYIEVHVDKIAQLFHTLDPFPFREKDLDQDVESYIVSWARELPGNEPIRIIIYLSDIEFRTSGLKDISEAFSRYFTGRAVVIQHELNELFRIGRRSLGIGIAILILCLSSAHFADGYLIDAQLKTVARESFLILGWVANWRPLEIFLYDWWPIAQRRALYRRLAAASVELQPYSLALMQEPIPSRSPS
mgnify:CR=1 FL=1|jgi:hypothetical protein